MYAYVSVRDDDEMTGETTMCDDSTTGSTMTMMAGCGGGDELMTRVFINTSVRLY